MTMALALKKRKKDPVAGMKRETRYPEAAVILPRRGKEQAAAEPRDYGLSHQIIWDLVSISNHLEEMRRCWARLFGISGPQWLILMAINDLDQGSGVSVGEVSAKVHAVSTFVTKQT